MNGYTRVTINNKEYGIKFTMWALEKMDELNAQHPSNMQRPANMIYAGLLNNCRHSKTKLEISYEDVELFVDDLFETDEGRDTIKAIDKCLEESGSYKYVLEQSEENKKKLNGTPSIASPLVNSD